LSRRGPRTGALVGRRVATRARSDFESARLLSPVRAGVWQECHGTAN